VVANSSVARVVSERRSNAGNTHLAGEFFVAAELSKRGYAVALTMGNAKAVDLFVEKRGKSLPIQVKALAHKRNVGWPLPLDQSKIIDGVIYVCVVLNEEGQPPTYYVVPPEQVRQRGNWYSTRAILTIGALKSGDFEGAWSVIEEALADVGRPLATD
jgi:hypothetical protein